MTTETESEIASMTTSNRNEGVEQKETPQQPDMRPPRGPSGRMSPIPRFALVAAVIVLVIAVVTIGAVVLLKNTSMGTSAPHDNAGDVPISALAANANGTVSFIDAPGGAGHTDAVKLEINGLLNPPSGDQYTAWLVNSTSKQTFMLGTLTNQNQVYTLNYNGNGTNLLSEGDTINITLEHGAVSAPSGKVLLSAAFPPQAFVYIRHLLASYSATPGQTGLLVGLYEQARALNTGALKLPGFASQHNTQAVQCTAQNLLDIIEGKAGAHYQPLAPACASLGIASTSDGFGLLGNDGYVAVSQAQVSLAANTSDATTNIKVHERHVSYALQDMHDWLTTLDADALRLLSNPGATSGVANIVTLANHDLYGVDLNHDGSIDYVPGEAGATIAYIHGQYMAALVLAPAS
jgi:hypothetical protein